jgi:hypothetical protein
MSVRIGYGVDRMHLITPKRSNSINSPTPYLSDIYYYFPGAFASFTASNHDNRYEKVNRGPFSPATFCSPARPLAQPPSEYRLPQGAGVLLPPLTP